MSWNPSSVWSHASSHWEQSQVEGCLCTGLPDPFYLAICPLICMAYLFGSWDVCILIFFSASDVALLRVLLWNFIYPGNLPGLCPDLLTNRTI